MCLPDVLRGSAVGELVCEVTAVGEYAGRPLKAGDAAQPVGLLCPLCACCVRAGLDLLLVRVGFVLAEWRDRKINLGS